MYLQGCIGQNSKLGVHEGTLDHDWLAPHPFPCSPPFALPLYQAESDGQSVQGDADLQSTIQQQSSDIASLREQCSSHAKERAALKTILDAKIKALVDDIGQSVADLPPEVSHQCAVI